MTTAQGRKRKTISLIRVSTDEQADIEKRKTGIARQRLQIKTTCRIHNLEDVKQFQLEGIVGIAVRNTPEFLEMKKWLRRGDIVGLVIPEMSRLSRTTEFKNVADLLEPFEILVSGKNTKSIFLREHELDVTEGKDRDTIWKGLRFAEEEKATWAERGSEGRDILRADPYTKIDKPPNGILWDQPNPKVNYGIYSYDPSVKARMHDSYLRVLNGESLYAVYKDAGYKTVMGFRSSLQSKWWIGIKAKTHHHTERGEWSDKKQKYMRKGRKKLDAEQIIEAEVPELRSDPCVTDETWHAVQDILNRNIKEWSTKKSQYNMFLLSDCARCSCGRKLYHKINTTNKKPYYYCSRLRHPDKEGAACEVQTLRADKVDDEAKLQVVTQLGNSKVVYGLIKDSFNTEAVEEKKRKVARIEETLKESQRLLKNAEDLAEKMGLSPERQQRIRDRESDVAEGKEKLKRAGDELALTLTDNDVQRVAEKIAADFADFPQLKIEDQKLLLKKYVTRADVWFPTLERDGYQGSPVVRFGVTVGVLEFQRGDEWQKTTEKKKPGRATAEPIRVVKGGMYGGVERLPVRKRSTLDRTV